MNKKQKRQQKIINFIQNEDKVSNSEILEFLGESIERTTLQRDLNYLQQQGFVSKTGSGPSTVYFITEINKISLSVNIEKYFDIPYLKREIKESFNFKIFKILQGNIFTKEEKEKLENLQRNFIKNFSKYLP